VNREQIDIEGLLIRAYREKAVDRFVIADDAERRRKAWGLILLAGPSSGGGGGGEALGVQSSGYATNLAARASRGWAMLDKDRGGSLEALHDAVLALPTFYVERVGEADELAFEVWDTETALKLGHRIVSENGAAYVERVRRRGGKDAKRADQLRTAGPRRPVTAIVATNLMICHGRAADRPYVPPVVATGRRPILKGRDKCAVGYAATYETTLAEVVRARALYATWHACLGMLQAALGCVPDLDVTGPEAPAAPWDDVSGEGVGAVRASGISPRAKGKSDVFSMA